MNLVCGYGSYPRKHIQFQSPKNWGDIKNRVFRIKKFLNDISNIESQKYIARVTMMETINEDVMSEIYDTFDTLISIKKTAVSAMCKALLDYDDQVEFTTKQVYIDYLNEELFNLDYEHYSLLDNIRTYW